MTDDLTWHREVLSAPQWQAFAFCRDNFHPLGGFLAGGTALALRYGHRRSRDLDWFTTSEFQAVEVAGRLAHSADAHIIRAEAGTIHAEIAGIAVSFMRFHYQPGVCDHLDGAAIASIRTSAAMKCLALVNRGYKRDFIDLAALFAAGFSLATIIDWATKDIPGLTPASILRACSWREEAEKQDHPEGIDDVRWERSVQDVDEALRKYIQN